MKQRITRANNVGRLTALIGLLLLAPLLVLPFFQEDAQYAAAFLIPGIASILLGWALCLWLPARPLTMLEDMHHGNLLVLYIWLYSCLAGALPFVLGGRLTFVQALFEAVSGWTTTGLSVMDVTVTPPIFLFYRSFMQFCGGLGFVMIMMTFVQGRMGMVLYSAEGRGLYFALSGFGSKYPDTRETAQPKPRRSLKTQGFHCCFTTARLMAERSGQPSIKMVFFSGNYPHDPFHRITGMVSSLD